MTLEVEIGKELHESFRAALVLTVSIEAAESVVTDAIATVGSDASIDELLVGTVRSAFRCHRSPSEGSSLPSILPLELRALFLLSPTCRYCFVLLFLIGLNIETCSEILRLSSDEFEEALCESLHTLPRAVESVRCVDGRCRPTYASGSIEREFVFVRSDQTRTEEQQMTLKIFDADSDTRHCPGE
jgi:hypothetical protein